MLTWDSLEVLINAHDAALDEVLSWERHQNANDVVRFEGFHDADVVVIAHPVIKRPPA